MKSLSLTEPHIIAMVGAPGAGKTRFALQFAETFSAPFINDQPLRACATNPDEGSALGLEIIKQIMRTRETLVFEGELDMRIDRDALIKLAKTHGYKVLFVWVQADQQVAKARALKQIAVDEYERRIKHFSAPHESEPYIVISGHHTHATQTRTVLAHLAKPRAQAPVQSRTTVARTTPRRATGQLRVN